MDNLNYPKDPVESLVHDHVSLSIGNLVAQDPTLGYQHLEVTQHDEEDCSMEDAPSWADESQSEDVSDDETGLSIPAPTPVDSGELDELEENFEIDSSDAIEEYAPGDLPANFPAQIERLIRHIPHDEPSIEHIRGFAVDLITIPFGYGEDHNVQLVQQLAALLEQAPPHIICAIEDVITDLAITCMKSSGFRELVLGDFALDHGGASGNSVIMWLETIPDHVLEDIFGIPITGRNLIHLLNHIVFTVVQGEPNQVLMELEPCAESGYTPQASEKTVQYFIDSLPEVPLESLAEDDRECGICREVYTEGPSLLNGVPESAVRLPCGHVFGDLCLTVLLSPNLEGWERRLCPLCRAVVPLLPKTPLGDILEAT